jgi:DNA-binding protein WhiA
MSFAAQTKKELTMIENAPCCALAELAALIRMSGSLQLSTQGVQMDISTENAALARRIYTYIKQLFQIHAELVVRKKMRLKKNNVYIVRLAESVQEVLTKLSIVGEGFQFRDDISPKLIKKGCCKKAYLRGAFLAGGSVNNPVGASYHLEIFSLYAGHSSALCQLLNRYDLNARVIERKKGFVIYIKEGEKIIDFLNLIGAHHALFRFEDVLIMKDMRNSVNRLVNCETANLNKTIGAALRQIENIRLLEEEVGLDNLPPKLREVAQLRLLHPDLNLKEIGEMLSDGTSKSGVNHRLRKLDEMAEQLRETKKTIEMLTKS